MVEIKSVGHPPEMEDATDYIVEKESGKRYHFTVPERGIFILRIVTEPVSPKKSEEVDFTKPLPDEVESGLRDYFQRNYGEEIEIKYSE